MPRRRRRRVLLGVLVAALLVGTVLVAVVAGSDDDNTVAQNAAKSSATVRGSHRVLRAWGVDLSAARPALQSNGASISVAENDSAACLVRQDENDRCYSKSTIATGLGYSISNDCSAGGDRAMLVRGFGPKGAAAVEIVYSDNNVPLRADLADGAFYFATTTPKKGEPYPVAVRYLNADGAQMRSQPIADGNNLCLDDPR